MFLFHFVFQRYLKVIADSGHGFICSLEKRNGFILYFWGCFLIYNEYCSWASHENIWLPTAEYACDEQLFTKVIWSHLFCEGISPHFLIPYPLLPIFYYYIWNILCFGTFVWNMWTTGTWIDSEKMSFWATFLTGSFSDPILTRFLNFVAEWKNCLLLVKSL